MQLDDCFIRLYSNVAGQANHLQYHQDGNRQYTRVLVKISSRNNIMSVVCFRKLGRPDSEFRISQLVAPTMGATQGRSWLRTIYMTWNTVFLQCQHPVESRPPLSLPLTGSQLRQAQLACGHGTETPLMTSHHCLCQHRTWRTAGLSHGMASR